jgi:hypothetical protein
MLTTVTLSRHTDVAMPRLLQKLLSLTSEFAYELLMVSGKSVLKGIFVLEGDELTREWTKLHNEEVHNL